MRHRKRRKKTRKLTPTEKNVAELSKQGRQKVKLNQYNDAIIYYEAALDIVRQNPYKLRIQYDLICPKLAKLYVKEGRIDQARVLYQEYLAHLFKIRHKQKLQRAYSLSCNIVGVDLEVNLFSILLEEENLNAIFRFPSFTRNRLFTQAVDSYETNQDSFTYSVIQKLFPEVRLESPLPSDSIELLLTQQNGIEQILERLRENTSSTVPGPASLSCIDESEQRQNIREIRLKRRHGSLMYRGAGYGIRVALYFSLKLLMDKQGITRVEIEGIEDFDIYYHQNATYSPPEVLPPRAYVQVKSRDEGRSPWSISGLKDVFNDFAEVHIQDASANFLFVTDYHFGQKTTLSGVLDYPNLLTFHHDHDICDEILQALKTEHTSHEGFNLETFLNRIHFLRLPRDLDDELSDRLARLTDSLKRVAVRYYDVLFKRIYALAEGDKRKGHTKSFTKADLKRLLHEMKETVDSSSLEQPIRNGNLELLTFGASSKTSPTPDPNYYLGTKARIRHILAKQDIPRPELMHELGGMLVQGQFCVLRSPSGTGKTTLMYRFAYEYRDSFDIYRLRRLEGNNEVIEQCVRYIKNLEPSEQSRVLLLIDDISRPEKQGWQEFLESVLENSNILVIATTREDEWSDSLARGIRPEYVTLSLSEDTAHRFHQTLKDGGQLHPNYPDWQEAYENSKVEGKALFMEYAHILTQGKRIQEVLSEQVERIANQPATEDSRIQMNLLRLICTAHSFGGRVPVELLAAMIDPPGEDLWRHLKHLADEHHHLISLDQDYYIGLHEIRSQYLRDLLHQYPPPSLRQSLTKLIEHLPLKELAPIVEGVCRFQPKVATQMTKALATRFNQDGTLSDMADVIRRLYSSSEWHYAQQIKEHIDQFGVDPREVKILSYELLPTRDKPLGIFKIYPFRDEVREAFKTAPKRGTDRFEQRMCPHLDVGSLVDKLSTEHDVASIVYFLNWLREGDQALVGQVLNRVDTQHLANLVFGEASGQRAASLVLHIWLSNPLTYKQLLEVLGGQQSLIDKLKSSFPSIINIDLDEQPPEGGVLHLQFWAEETLDELDPDADVSTKMKFIAGVATRMFPSVARVQTTGLDKTGRVYEGSPYDPVTKNIPDEKFTILEDVEKNHIWQRAILSQYTYKTWYAYLQQQDVLREKYIDSIRLLGGLLQTLRKPQSKPSKSNKEFAELLYKYHEIVDDEARSLLFPPDPVSSFVASRVIIEPNLDPLEEQHKLLSEGIYYQNLISESGADSHFRSYTYQAKFCIQILFEYIFSQKNKYICKLKSNANKLVDCLKKFHEERETMRFSQSAHMDLAPIELRLASRIQQASHHVFDRTYQDLWSKAETLSKKIHLLASRVDALSQQRESPDDRFKNALAQTLCRELAAALPSIVVLSRLNDLLQDTSNTIVMDEIGVCMQSVSSLTVLDCFIGLAEFRQKSLQTTRTNDV